MILAINASRARSGGAKAHLVGILSEYDPIVYGFDEVHVWSYGDMLGQLPDRQWLFKHRAPHETSLVLQQLWWERFILPNELISIKCDILFNVDAGTVCRFHPNVTLSQDMLSYEPGEIERYGWSMARLRLILLRYVQNSSLQKADSAIFLTRYAARVIQLSCGQLRHHSVIPHGVGLDFYQVKRTLVSSKNRERALRLLYVSNAALYKHQWMVIRAVEQLRNEGFNLTLQLVGGGSGSAQRRLSKQMRLSDPRAEYVTQHEFVHHVCLPDYLSDADIFIFASSCENMPITLLEAMAAGLPIACSQRGPMPEILEDGGEYFNPELPPSIAYALRRLIQDPDLRQRLGRRAKQLSMQYSWSRCAKETWSFISNTYHRLPKSLLTNQVIPAKMDQPLD